MNHKSLSIISLLACLIGYSAGREAIINGALAAQNQYPYHVAIHIPNEGYICGGAILSRRHVLTAAHCIILARNEFVRDPRILAGTNDYQQTGPPAQSIQVAKAYILNNYEYIYHNSLSNIAVLKLRDPLVMNNPQRPLKSVRLPTDLHNDYYDRNATITGFGWDWVVSVNGLMTNGGNAHTQLRHAVAAVLNQEQCQTINRQHRITEKHLCARITQIPEVARSVCLRDGGGPLVFNGTVIGILSRNPRDCSEIRGAGIYTRVTSFVGFIRNAVHDITTNQMRTHVYREGHED